MISIPAGMEFMPLRKFLIWTTLGSLIWVAILTYAGFILGDNWQVIESYLGQYKYIVKPVLIVLILYLLFKFVFGVYKRNRT